MAASEVAPFAKTGGLADVAGALTKFLDAAGHDVRLFMPFYSRIDRQGLDLQHVDFLQDLQLEFNGHRYQYSVWSARLPNSDARCYLIECGALYGRDAIYTSDVDEHLRFLALTRATIETCQRMGWSPQIFHCNDWHTAFAPLLLKSVYAWDALFAETKSLLTIHNIGYQGIFPSALAADVGLGDSSYLLHQADLAGGRVNSLKHGIVYADAITTVSPSYAREILTDELGMGLQQDLRARADVLSGILNGVDYDDWDPRWDRYLPRTYGAFELNVKAELKQELMQRLGIQAAAGAALLGIVSRMTVQKGFDLLFDSLPTLLARRNACLVVLGSGDAVYENFFVQLRRQFPQRVVFHRGYSEALAHWIEAASDLFIMPSRYEPCGTIPIVRRTGGLADSVQLYDPASGEGDGIVFDNFNAEAMTWALNAGLDLYAQPEHWQRMIHNAMAKDYSWDKQGVLYVQLYERLLAQS
jgi:starch synthase